MPVEILISDFKLFNEFKNDVGFVSNLSDFTLNLAAGVMENVKADFFVDISWNSQSTLGNFWETTQTTMTRETGSWIGDGFSVGDTVAIQRRDSAGVVLSTHTATIGSLSDTLMVFTAPVVPPFAVSPETLTNSLIHGTTPLEALIYGFGLIGNNDTFNITSKVSQNDQGYEGSSIGFDTGGGVRDTNAVDLTPIGQYEDWRTSELVTDVTMTARYDSNPTTFVQRFQITHEFTIVPYYLDGELDNLQDNIIPDLLDGKNSLKYVFAPEFLTVLSNPNTGKKVNYDQQLGSVAWFNENFNGFRKDYNVVSVAYEDFATTDPLDGIQINTKTKITVTVERLSTPYVGSERFGAYISYLPEQSEYQNTTATNLKNNFIYDRAINNEGLAPVAGGDFITACSATEVAGELVIVIELDYSTAQKTFLAGKVSEGETNYLLGIQVGDTTLSSGNSDRLIILADVREFDEGADIPDLMDVTKFNLFSHDEQIGVDTPSTNKVAWNEEGLAIDFTFELDLNKDAVINTLEFKLLAYNTVTDETFDLDSYSYGVGSAVTSGGVQQLITDATRGYILKSGDQFNETTLSVGSNAGGIQEYNGTFAQKTSWQEWIQNIDADTIFFDNLEPNNNLNFKSSNYSLKDNYEIRLAVSANLDGTSTLGVAGNTDYLFLSPNITVFDYEEDGNVTPIWSCVIETFNNSNLAPLGTSVLSGTDTLFRATWSSTNGAITDLTDFWGINRIEEAEQTGYAITEMSSLNDPDTNQLLIPSVGTLLDMTIVAGDVVMECLIDGSLASSLVSYSLSSEINTPSTAGKETEEGILKDTETGVVKEIE